MPSGGGAAPAAAAAAPAAGAPAKGKNICYILFSIISLM